MDVWTRRADSPVGVGCDLSGVVFEALAVLLYGLLVLSFLHQGVAFFFQNLAFLFVFIAGSWRQEKQGEERSAMKKWGQRDELKSESAPDFDCMHRRKCILTAACGSFWKNALMWRQSHVNTAKVMILTFHHVHRMCFYILHELSGARQAVSAMVDCRGPTTASQTRIQFSYISHLKNWSRHLAVWAFPCWEVFAYSKICTIFMKANV